MSVCLRRACTAATVQTAWQRTRAAVSPAGTGTSVERGAHSATHSHARTTLIATRSQEDSTARQSHYLSFSLLFNRT